MDADRIAPLLYTIMTKDRGNSLAIIINTAKIYLCLVPGGQTLRITGEYQSVTELLGLISE